MKKMIKFFATAAIAALALVSCNKEIEVSVTPADQGIKVSLKADGLTKTFLDGSTLKWKSTDAVGVFTGATATNAMFTNTEADGTTAVFNGAVPEVGTYYAYYPHSALGVDIEKGGAKFKFPETQYPSATSFDGAADLLLSEGFDVPSTGSENISVRFRRLGGFLKFSFTDGTAGTKLAGEHAALVKVIVNNVYGDGSKRPCPTVYVTPSGIGTIGAGMKTIKAVYDAGVYELTADGKSAWFGVLPQTFATGSTFEISIETDNYFITKTLTLTSNVELGAGDVLPIKVNLADANVTKNKLAKVWGNHGVAGVAGWPAYVSGAEGLDGALRNACFDDDYVYIPKTSGASADGSNFDEASVFMFNVSDGAYAGKVQRTTEPDYMAGVWASTHPVSCARMIKNTNPSLNGGKDILIVSNLCDGAGQRVRIYAWENGVNNQPKCLGNFASMAERRWGDRIWTEGTYQSGRIWVRNWYAVGTTAWLPLTDGSAPGAFDALGAIAVDEANNISDYKNIGSGYGIISTASGNGIHLISGTSVSKTYAGYKRCFGWEAFTYNAKNYLAYLDLSGGTNLPIVVVLEGNTDSLSNLEATLDAKNIVARAAIATPYQNDFATTGVYATSSVGDCIVRFIGGVPYILGMTRAGIALFRFEP